MQKQPPVSELHPICKTRSTMEVQFTIGAAFVSVQGLQDQMT